jgi:hypothetical protein
MQKRAVMILALLLAGALALAACGDDSNPTGGGGNGDGTTDTSPPGIASVNAVDERHVDVEFDEAVLRETAERRDNYIIVEVAGPAPVSRAAPDDTIRVGAAALDDDGKTVHLTTDESMLDADYEITITGVQDTKGNTINEPASDSFRGSPDPDVTAPTIVYRSPEPGEEGVGIGQPVVVGFSESMDYGSVLSAFSWTGGGGPVDYDVDTWDGNTFVFTPLAALMNNTTYDVMLTGEAQDGAGNSLTSTVWSFTTTPDVDTTPPTLTSSSPANGATNVPLASNLVLIFSEPVEQTSLNEVLISPEIGDGVPVWSNGGRTVTFDPFANMMPNTQYNLLIPPGDVRDLAGNSNVDAIQIVWSTGSSLATGGISGTLTGPGSADAPTPLGGIAIAADRNPFGDDDGFLIGGTDVVGSTGDYAITNLPDGEWWPICMLDANDDGEIDPSLGDAVGALGVTFNPMAGAPDSVIITGGSTISGVDFELFDPSAFVGTFDYIGSGFPGCCYQYYIWLFDTDGFDINNPGEADFVSDGHSWPGDSEWSMNQLDDELQPGTYYVGAFLDGNGNQDLDANEPWGFIGGMTPTPFTVVNGTDALGLSITLDDPFTPAPSITWKARDADPRKDLLRRLANAVKRATAR